ncbi:MAG: PH domain-containing protein [Propionibacteriaceae bacterium]|jgi:membrane protein YdbS with pleckstrin-like domain|nr:PH domain-containing protein [Propionibacteriaceae bacterium]
MGERPSLFFPDVRRYLLVEEGEQIVDEVVKHPVCMIVPLFFVLVGILTMLAAPLAHQFWLLVVIIGAVVGLIGLWKLHSRSMDRFVITNMRVYRVNGIINRHVATMPLTRILDISVYQSLVGMALNYGHFTFESAALDQGLRKITFVGDPKRRDLTIQRVIQRAGIRAMAQAKDEPDGS